MICPQCKAEYQSDINACADCQVPLVSSLEENLESQDANLEQIGNFQIIFSSPSGEEVNMVKGLLESNGIFPLIYNPNSTRLNPFARSMNVDIRLFVHMNQRAQANDVLKNYIGSTEAEQPSNDTSVTATPTKGSCSVCGNVARNAANFCDQCGQPLTTVESQ